MSTAPAPTTVLLASGRPAHHAAFVAAVAEVEELEVVARCDRADEVVTAVGRHRPDVVVLDDTLGPGAAHDLARQLVRADPGCGIVAWVDREERHHLAAALDAGMRAVLGRPLAVEDATAKLQATAAWSGRVHGLGHPAHPEPAPALLVALLGAKGGVGTSTLAVQLARRSVLAGRATVLADLDLATPDLTGLLDLGRQRSILDLVPVADHLDGRYLADALSPHPSGLRVLLGPTEGERADEVDERAARLVLGALRSHVPSVVVDCGSRLDEATATALEVADRALLVVTPDVPCLLAARRHLAAFDRLAIRPDDGTTVVVNRHGRRTELSPAVVAGTLGVPVAEAVVPDRPAAFHRAADDADPAAVVDRAVARALDRLARDLDLTGPVRPADPAPRRRPSPGSGPPRRRRQGARRPSRGQVAIEAVGLLPLLVLAVLLCLQGLAAVASAGAADDAARAAARAAALGQDPRAAAAEALPHWLDHRLARVRIRRVDGTVRATVELRVPGPAAAVVGPVVRGQATFAAGGR